MGYFFREVDFSQDVDYAEFCNLKIDSIYRWNKGSWSAICGDLFIYVTLNNNELWVGKSEVELEEPKIIDKIDLVQRHFEMSVKWKGPKLAIYETRKHYG